MSEEPTKSVKLTLQETGFLHNQMTKIIVDQGTKGLPQWFFDLYSKLGETNDKLMHKINITLEEAQSIIDELTNGVIEGISPGKNGRAWLSGEFDLSELEALCVIVRHEAGSNAQGAEELIAHWKSNDL